MCFSLVCSVSPRCSMAMKVKKKKYSLVKCYKRHCPLSIYQIVCFLLLREPGCPKKKNPELNTHFKASPTLTREVVCNFCRVSMSNPPHTVTSFLLDPEWVSECLWRKKGEETLQAESHKFPFSCLFFSFCSLFLPSLVPSRFFSWWCLLGLVE